MGLIWNAHLPTTFPTTEIRQYSKGEVNWGYQEGPHLGVGTLAEFLKEVEYLRDEGKKEKHFWNPRRLIPSPKQKYVL